MTSQDPVTSKSHTFQGHHGDVRSRSEKATDRLLSNFLGHFSDGSRPFPVSLFLSFFLRLRGFSFSFLFLSHFSFCLCSCTGISVLLWLASRFPRPLFPPLNIIPLEKYTCMRSVNCRVISSSHVQFDEMKVRH